MDAASTSATIHGGASCIMCPVNQVVGLERTQYLKETDLHRNILFSWPAWLGLTVVGPNQGPNQQLVPTSLNQPQPRQYSLLSVQGHKHVVKVPVHLHACGGGQLSDDRALISNRSTEGSIYVQANLRVYWEFRPS
jgi:hypothetical protein